MQEILSSGASVILGDIRVGYLCFQKNAVQDIFVMDDGLNLNFLHESYYPAFPQMVVSALLATVPQ